MLNTCTSFTILWSHSPYFATHPQKCTIYCGSYVISPPIPVTQGSFKWTVGRKQDGTSLPNGKYEITIESPDYDALSGPTILILGR